MKRKSNTIKNYFKTINTTILLVVAFGVINAQTIDTLRFSVDDIEMEIIGNYNKVSIPFCETTGEIGNPELPCFKLQYIIPFGKRVNSITILDSTMSVLRGNYLVYPKQPEQPLIDTIEHGFVLPNMAIYSSDNPYPTEMVSVMKHYNIDGFQLIELLVCPIRYFPIDRKLELLTSICFQLNYEDNLDTVLRPLTQPKNLYEITKKTICSQVRNSDKFDQIGGGPINITERNTMASQGIRLLDMPIDVEPEYIIITNNYDVNGNSLYDAVIEKNMSEVFQELADYKTRKGIPTKVVTIDTICANYTGNDVQTKIHNFLSDVYQHYGMLFVLFGGDVNVVPTRLIDSVLYENNFSSKLVSPFHTDLYYTAVESSWDSNGNGIYGESIYSHSYNDILDKTPEYYYGRAPVNNVLEAETFVNKILIYEMLSSVEDKNYVNNIGAMVGFLEEKDIETNNLNEVMTQTETVFGNTIPVGRNGIIQTNIVKWRSYDTDHIYPSVMNYWMEFYKDNTIACFNSYIPLSLMQQQRSHITLHADHSSYSSMGTSALKNRQVINRNEVDEFMNAPYYQIVYSLGCYAGDYNKDCIAEHFINNPQGGAVAIIASSTICFPSESHKLQNMLWSLYENKRQGRVYDPIEYRSGPLSNIYRGSNLFMSKNHLFGDPELPIWTREPVELTVSTTPTAFTNQNNDLTVSVSGMIYSEYATNDVDVCVMKDGEVYLREHYNGSAHNHDFVFEDIHPETAGELMVTVTGHNYIPYETSIPVTITGKNVYITDKSVVDATGNNDGKLDAGETDNLSIALKNNGMVNLTNVTATLSCEFLDNNLNQSINDYLTIVTSTANYGTIAQNATVTKNDFQLTLSNAIPDRTPLRCTLTISDGSGIICEKSFTFCIYAPEIEYVSVRHETKQNGRIGLDIDLDNLGFGTAKNVVATLTSTSGVQITQGTATYGTMVHLEAKTQSFEFIPNGNGGYEDTPFSLTIIDAYNKSWSYGFILKTISDTVENLTFTSTEHSITLKWDPVENSRGYYIYRTLTTDGNYERLNGYPVPSAVYPDLGLGSMQTYYYGVSYLDEYGNESEKARITAWTSLPVAEGWPVTIPDELGRAWGTAPNVADVDGDGMQEIFLTTGNADNPGDMGAILAFNNLGEELYDIDHNPTTVSGFANLGISMNCAPAIGDIDNDGIMEIVAATRGDLSGGNHKLFVFKNTDADEDGAPDFAWDSSLDTSNFNGVVLADLDDNGTLEIIAPNQGKGGVQDTTFLEVFDCYGVYYYQRDTIRVIDSCNIDQKAVTMPVVADFDNDGHKEIVFGFEGGVYKWACSDQVLSPIFSSNPSPNDTDNKERADCPIIAADIDSDGDLEILYLVIKDLRGYVKAKEISGTPVNNAWSGDTHSISLSSTYHDWEWPPYFCVADIDNNGGIEIFVADRDTLKIWNSDGTTFGEILIPNLDCRYFQPVIADVDGNGDCEIIVPSQNGYIYAYKPNGNPVPGWPLAVDALATIPVVTDIDGDGYNEVIAASQTEVYVWHTEGESKYNHWDRFRYNQYNNAVYETPCSYNEDPLEIDGTQVWNNDRQFNRDVVINSGAGLTIKSDIRFSSDSKIIVKPGGRLILDGCRLTNACPDEFWHGIEVWGNYFTHQFPTNGSYGQGYLEMKNGATIENAICAVELWRPNYWSTTGGIIHASDATFRNNATSIHALYYTNHNPYPNPNINQNVEMDYNGFFENCNFVIDEDYLGTVVFTRHVTLDNVKGIGFQGCDFSVNREVTGVDPDCKGIQANDASFSVNSLCTSTEPMPCPEEYLKKSTFTGFCSGIKALGSGITPHSFSVRNTVFMDNDGGIYAANTGFPTILMNEFNISRVNNHCTSNYGIYLDYVTGFSIEENTFQPVAGSGGSTIGIAVSNSNGVNDIYRNDFSGLSQANLALGQNYIDNIYGKVLPGLTYTCNTFSGNQQDIVVLKEDGVGNIQTEQGSSAVPAGNTFNNSVSQIYNDGTRQINYYYNSNQSGETPDNTMVYGVNLKGYAIANPCRSHYGNGPVLRSASEKAALVSDYLSAYTAYQDLDRLYERRIDGGNTSVQLANINSATSANMWQLRAQLLGLSPYVSKRVLTSAADRDDVFIDPVLFEILAANPDELRDDSLISYLESKAHPLPDYMIALLRQMASGSTARTALIAQMDRYRHDYSLAAGDIVRSNLNDSIANPTELRNWLGNMNDIAADRMVIASYLQEGDSVSAFALANMLPDLYGLQGDQLSDHADYIRLIQLYQTLNRTHRTMHELTTIETNMVNGIAEEGVGVSRLMARSLLEMVSGEIMETCLDPEIPESLNGNKGRATIVQDPVDNAIGFIVDVSPNPATTWAVVDYTLPSKMSKASIVITNTLGITVMSTELNGDQGQKVLDLRDLADGVYFVRISDGEKHSKIIKLVKQK